MLIDSQGFLPPKKCVTSMKYFAMWIRQYYEREFTFHFYYSGFHSMTLETFLKQILILDWIPLSRGQYNICHILPTQKCIYHSAISGISGV